MKTLLKLTLALALVVTAWANSHEALNRNGATIILKTADWPGTISTPEASTSASRDIQNGNYAIACQNAEGSYDINMENYIYSPVVSLPAGNTVVGDFVIRGSFADPNEFPDVDFWGVEVSPDAGTTWYYVSNPYDDPAGSNYVYSDAPAEWSSFNDSYSTPINIDNYAAMDVQFRWYFHSDADSPMGEGIFVDDFSLTVDGSVTYMEDFEDGNLDGWVSEDATATPPLWHQSTVNAYAGQSWAMNDPEIGNAGGYLDHWYQTFDSPEVALPTAAPVTLTFMQNRNVEAIVGATAPYNGWDGTNVRISVDGGTTWTVLTGVVPAYNSTSLYSFGFEFGEGAGVAGWGGSSNGWQAVTFTIPEAYYGQNAMFRWAFASDPGFSTPDDPTMFGWLIDDIDIAGVLTNDGETSDGWVAASQVPIAGDLWHIVFVAELPSPMSLTAEASDSQVDLTWQTPVTGATQGLQYDSGAYSYYLNDMQPYGVVFDIADDGTVVKNAKLSLYGNPAFVGLTDVFVYAVNDTGAPSTLLHTVTGVVPATYPTQTVVDLQSAGLIFNAGEQFAIGVGNFSGGNQGVLAEQDTVGSLPTGHSFVFGGDAWYAIDYAYTAISNLGIRADVVVPGEGLTPISYNLYRRTTGMEYGDALLANYVGLAYSDASVNNGTEYYYAVSANYEMGGEGVLSGEVYAMPESQSVYEISYDDGTAEAGWDNQGAYGTYMAVKFTPEAYPVTIKRLRYFVNGESSGNARLIVWDDEGANGNPSDETGDETGDLTYLTSSLGPGWNAIDISADSIRITSGSFYVGLKRFTSTPAIGVDQTGDAADRSFVNLGSSWESFSSLGLAYNLMIRADLDSTGAVVGVDKRDNLIPITYSLSQNYPNPFNPLTTIDYSIAQTSDVRLTVYDISGKVMENMVNENQTVGNYSVTIDASRFASGVYFYRIETANFNATRKMILLK